MKLHRRTSSVSAIRGSSSANASRCIRPSNCCPRTSRCSLPFRRCIVRARRYAYCSGQQATMAEVDVIGTGRRIRDGALPIHAFSGQWVFWSCLSSGARSHAIGTLCERTVGSALPLGQASVTSELSRLYPNAIHRVHVALLPVIVGSSCRCPLHFEPRVRPHPGQIMIIRSTPW